MNGQSALEAVLKRDRLVVLAGLATVFVAAVAYTVLGVGMDMSAITMTRMAIRMPGMAMEPAAWSPGYALLIFLMWWLMMIAMMVPSAAPMVLLHAALARKHYREANEALRATAVFTGGYLAAWGGFSLIAATLQWGLERLGVVSGMMEIASPVIAGGVLVVAGLYQFTPLKHACLRHCQHPLTFVAHHWRPGLAGAWRMGLQHGSYCLGCCWLLMALLFVGGIMNLLWIAGIAVYVGLEKLAADRAWVTTATGIGLMLAGAWVLAGAMLGA